MLEDFYLDDQADEALADQAMEGLEIENRHDAEAP